MISAQDKILHVANKLGLTSLKDMQASTGAVYDVDSENAGLIFTNASRHVNPGVTNLTENQFEVNEALLIESIAFYAYNSDGKSTLNFQTQYGSNAVVVFDLIVGNKRVMKETPVFAAGQPTPFASIGLTSDGSISSYIPRHQIFMEGAGILIPPQVQFYIQYSIYDVVTGAIDPNPTNVNLGCYLFGTKVNLNFNTSI